MYFGKTPDGLSLMKERNIVTELKEFGFKETLTDEDYTVVSHIWFYGEVVDGCQDHFFIDGTCSKSPQSGREKYQKE